MPTTLQLLGGVLLAAGLIVLARLRGREVPVYGVVLVITAAYYVAVALLREPGAAPLELAGLALFGGLGLLGAWRWPWLLVLGWAGHVAWDVLFHTGGRGTYVPAWYPTLCAGFDLFLAGYVAGLLGRRPD